MKSIQIPCVGYSIAADWYESTKPEIMLILPGYSSSKKNQRGLVSSLIELTNMNALVIDYGGHGDSPFDLQDLTPAQNFLEVITAFDALRQKHPDMKINVIGNSYGSFLATQLTKYRKFDKLILRAPAIYRPEDFYTKWKNIDREATRHNYRKNVEALSEHPLLARASNFQGKTLVVVHENDEMVPKQTSDAYIKAFNPEVYLAKGFNHSFGDHLNEKEKIAAYQKHLADWLNQN